MRSTTFTPETGANLTTTSNGATSFKSTKQPALDFFFKVLRSTPAQTTRDMFRNVFADNNEHALKLAFHLRDCRGGKGERESFRTCIKWLAENSLELCLVNIKNIPKYGRWDDLFALIGTPAETVALGYYARALINDVKKLNPDPNTGNLESQPISLAAKWAPTENSSLDRRYEAAFKLARLLWNLSGKPMITSLTKNDLPPNNLKSLMTFYRKSFISLLRKNLKLVETKMSQRLWDAIEYAQVPSLCMFKHRKAFMKHSEERFQKYLTEVRHGTAKINASQVFPHQLVHHYMAGGSTDDTIDLQWEALVKQVSQSGSGGLGRSLAVVDVSGSMGALLTGSSYSCMDVSIALGLILAEVSPGPFRNTIITFSENPEFHEISGDTLNERIQNLRHANWSMTTNYHKVFEMILKQCATHNVPPKEMPERIFVFSDMQFNASLPVNSGCNRGSMSEHQKMVQKFRDAGYQPPEIVFWNLNGATVDFPETCDGVNYTDAGVAMVSGFSPALLQLFVDKGSLDPMDVMLSAIKNPRYDSVSTDTTISDDTVYEF